MRCDSSRPCGEPARREGASAGLVASAIADLEAAAARVRTSSPRARRARRPSPPNEDGAAGSVSRPVSGRGRQNGSSGGVRLHRERHVRERGESGKIDVSENERARPSRERSGESEGRDVAPANGWTPSRDAGPRRAGRSAWSCRRVGTDDRAVLALGHVRRPGRWQQAAEALRSPRIASSGSAIAGGGAGRRRRGATGEEHDHIKSGPARSAGRGQRRHTSSSSTARSRRRRDRERSPCRRDHHEHEARRARQLT